MNIPKAEVVSKLLCGCIWQYCCSHWICLHPA